jgi:hypothetical protein
MSSQAAGSASDSGSLSSSSLSAAGDRHQACVRSFSRLAIRVTANHRIRTAARGCTYSAAKNRRFRWPPGANMCRALSPPSSRQLNPCARDRLAGSPRCCPTASLQNGSHEPVHLPGGSRVRQGEQIHSQRRLRRNGCYGLLCVQPFSPGFSLLFFVKARKPGTGLGCQSFHEVPASLWQCVYHRFKRGIGAVLPLRLAVTPMVACTTR